MASRISRSHLGTSLPGKWQTFILLAVACVLARPAVANAQQHPVGDRPIDKAIEIIHQGDRDADPQDWHNWRASRGLARLRMTYQDFYRLAGRPDLAAQDATRRAFSTVTWITGGVMFFGGLMIAPWRFFKDDRTGALVGLLLAGAGFGTLELSSYLSRPAITEAQAADLARGYNESIGIGGEEGLTASAPRRGRPLSVLFRAVAGPHEGGLVVRGSFW